MKSKTLEGFSLVEVVIALGLAVFALLTMVALLPMGIKSNKISVEEMNAVGILTTLEADLRNSHPLLNSGKSQIFGLPLPYLSDASGKYSINSALSVNTLSSSYTTGVDQSGHPVPANSIPPPRYQATVIYISLPSAGGLAPVEARLIVNWPYLNASTVSNLTNPSQTTGFLDAYIAFPAP